MAPAVPTPPKPAPVKPTDPTKVPLPPAGPMRPAQWRPVWRATAWAALLVFAITVLAIWWIDVVDAKRDHPAPIAVHSANICSLFDQSTCEALVHLVKSTEQFFAWLFAYPLLPVVFGVIFWVSWGGLFQAQGIPDLFWPGSSWQRFWVGVGIALLFVHMLFMRYMLDLRNGERIDFGPFPPWKLVGPDGTELVVVARMMSFLFWTLLPLCGIYYFPKMFSAAFRRSLPWSREYVGGAPFTTLAGLVAGCALTFALITLDTRYGVSQGGLMDCFLGNLPGFSRIPPETVVLHRQAMVFFVFSFLILALFLVESRLGGVWSPVWSFCLIAALGFSVYTFASFHLAGLQYVLLLLGVLLVWLANRRHPFKFTLPGLEPYYARLDKNPVVFDRPPDPARPGIPAAAWLANFEARSRPAGDARKPKMVIVCTTGGGIRAAVWTAVALEGLEKAMPERFRDHIRLFAGASGGMVGAALYAADFENRRKVVPLSTLLARDCLWPLVQTFLFRDLPSLAYPRAARWDRGQSLGAALCDNTRPYGPEWGEIGSLRRFVVRGARALGLLKSWVRPASPFEKTFADLRREELEAARPSLLFSPMLVEDCRRILIGNLDVGDLLASECASLNPGLDGMPDPRVQSLSALDFWRYFPDADGTFAVGTAARMNASFPYASPGVALPALPARRVVDAGYFDNFGGNLVGRWLIANHEHLVAHTSGVVVIDLRAYPRRVEKVLVGGQAPADARGEDPNDFNWLAGELGTPPEAVVNLYGRGAYFRNDQVFQEVDRLYNARPDAPEMEKFLTTVTFECDGQAALSWTLPDWEVKRMRESFFDAEGNPQKWIGPGLDNLRKWFGNGLA